MGHRVHQRYLPMSSPFGKGGARKPPRQTPVSNQTDYRYKPSARRANFPIGAGLLCSWRDIKSNIWLGRVLIDDCFQPAENTLAPSLSANDYCLPSLLLINKIQRLKSTQLAALGCQSPQPLDSKLSHPACCESKNGCSPLLTSRSTRLYHRWTSPCNACSHCATLTPAAHDRRGHIQ